MKKQLNIEGTKENAIPELDALAELYVNARDKRMEASQDEKEQKTLLLAEMKKRGLKVYRVDADVPLLVMITESLENIKVSEVEITGDDSDE